MVHAAYSFVRFTAIFASFGSCVITFMFASAYRYIPLAMNVSIVPILRNIAAIAAIRSAAMTFVLCCFSPNCDLFIPSLLVLGLFIVS